MREEWHVPHAAVWCAMITVGVRVRFCKPASVAAHHALSMCLRATATPPMVQYDTGLGACGRSVAPH